MSLYETIARECGHDTAEAVVRCFGGMRIYVPQKWTETHPLNAMGEDNARQLIQRFANENLEIPRFAAAGRHRTKLILDLYETGGLTLNQIARRTNCTERWVRRVLAGKPDRDQPSLL